MEVEGFSDDDSADRRRSVETETAETSGFRTGTTSGAVAILEGVPSMGVCRLWVAGVAEWLASAEGGVKDRVGVGFEGMGVVSAVGATGITATGTMDES